MAKVIEITKGSVQFRIVEGELKNRWILVAYKINTNIFRDAGKWKLTEEFIDLIDEHVSEYVKNGVEPPEAIAAPIMNFADDYVSSKKITIRAGDYISIQNYIREGKTNKSS